MVPDLERSYEHNMDMDSSSEAWDYRCATSLRAQNQRPANGQSLRAVPGSPDPKDGEVATTSQQLAEIMLPGGSDETEEASYHVYVAVA